MFPVNNAHVAINAFTIDISLEVNLLGLAAINKSDNIQIKNVQFLNIHSILYLSEQVPVQTDVCGHLNSLIM
jgi:hypothetical protein